MNLCSFKWEENNYARKKVANPLLNCIKRNGLVIQNVGNTFMSEKSNVPDVAKESAIDHVYISKNLNNQISINKAY